MSDQIEQRYKKIKVFNINEASKELKEKILNNYRFINVEDSLFYDSDIYLDSNIFKWSASKMYFSLDRDHYIQFTDLEVKDQLKFKKLLKLDKRTWDKISWEFVSNNKNNTIIEFQDVMGNTIDLDESFNSENNFWLIEKPSKPTEKQFIKLQKAKVIFDQLIKEAWEILDKDYNYLTEDEAIIETLENNNYDFNENGKII